MPKAFFEIEFVEFTLTLRYVLDQCDLTIETQLTINIMIQ